MITLGTAKAALDQFVRFVALELAPIWASPWTPIYNPLNHAVANTSQTSTTTRRS
jgi:hypothetical protein